MDITELTELIRERDLREVWRHSEDAVHHHVPFDRWRTNHRNACVAQFLFVVDQRAPKIECGGRETNEHVTPGYGRMREKARTALEEMVTLCWNHHLAYWAGYNWATANKKAERAYLTRLYPEYYAALSKETR